MCSVIRGDLSSIVYFLITLCIILCMKTLCLVVFFLCMTLLLENVILFDKFKNDYIRIS
jgi:hypothetical protein